MKKILLIVLLLVLLVGCSPFNIGLEFNSVMALFNSHFTTANMFNTARNNDYDKRVAYFRKLKEEAEEETP